MKRAILIGDSIRMGYQPLVAERLAGRFEVIGSEQNGGDSRRVLAELANWLAGPPPDVVHLNCGLHDLKIIRESGDYQVGLAEYERNVPAIFARLRELAPDARIVWATTTPVRDECYRDRKDFTRCKADVARYNAAALAAARAAGVEVNDLHAVVERAGRRLAVRDDGVHMTDLGNTALADAVAACIAR